MKITKGCLKQNHSGIVVNGQNPARSCFARPRDPSCFRPSGHGLPGIAVINPPACNLAEGRHRVAVSVWDASCNQRSVTGEVAIASFPSCSDADAQVPPTATLEVGEDPLLVSPGVLPKLRFTQTMKILGMSDLKLEKKVSAAWEPVPGKVLGPKGDLTRFPVESLCQVILRPAGLLEAGQTYRLSWTSALRNTADVPLVAGSREFTISSVTAGPSSAVAGGSVTHVATLGKRVFAAVRLAGTDRWSLGQFEIEGDRIQQIGELFGPLGGTFEMQGVNAMALFEHVPVPGGRPETLLLVTTNPQVGRPELNGVLWAFVVCPEPELGRNVGDLRFAVSLGPGSNGYAPTVDQVNGVIVVPRLVGSTLLISVEKAIRGWSSNMAGQVLNPMGGNLGAILQPFYMANPVDRHSGLNMPMSPGTAWAAALLPTVPGSSSATVDVLMGYTQVPFGGNETGAALRGMPVWRKPYDGATWKSEPPFVGPEGYGMASDRAIPGPATVKAAGTRVAIHRSVRAQEARSQALMTELLSGSREPYRRGDLDPRTRTGRTLVASPCASRSGWRGRFRWAAALDRVGRPASGPRSGHAGRPSARRSGSRGPADPAPRAPTSPPLNGSRH